MVWKLKNCYGEVNYMVTTSYQLKFGSNWTRDMACRGGCYMIWSFHTLYLLCNFNGTYCAISQRQSVKNTQLSHLLGPLHLYDTSLSYLDMSISGLWAVRHTRGSGTGKGLKIGIHQFKEQHQNQVKPCLWRLRYLWAGSRIHLTVFHRSKGLRLY